MIANGAGSTTNLPLDLIITAAPLAFNPTPTNIVVSVTGNQLELSWPADRTGWQLESNAVSVVSSASWFMVPGSTTTNRVFLPIDPSQASVFFRMLRS